MRNLTPLQKARAAECLGMAFSHHRVAQKLIDADEFAAAVARLYYAAFHAAKSACIELGEYSKKHSTWKSRFNRHFGQGQGWVPKSYVKLLNDLYVAREKVDYDGSLANDEALARQWEFKVALLLKKVRNNTPVYHYPEFIQHFLIDKLFSGHFVMALEFDFYCPRSYIHKERVQFQCQSDSYVSKTPRTLRTAGARAVKLMEAKRQEDYVLGWNNRLGQSGDMYLLFLDIDEIDEGKVKGALKDRKGWLFKSGNGFHFVGKRIYPSRKEWERRYREASGSKKLKDLIDVRHVDFSLRRGYSTLRIDKSAEKEFIPFMCWDNASD